MQPTPPPFVPWVWREAAGMTDTRHTEGVDATRRLEPPDTGLLGYEVDAVDGRLGEIDHANPGLPADCILVDTGTWLTSHRVLLPIGAVERIDHDQRTIHVDRTKNQIKDAPAYDPDTSEDDDYRQRLGDYYFQSYRTTPTN